MLPRWRVPWAVGRNGHPQAPARGTRPGDGRDGRGHARPAGSGAHRVQRHGLCRCGRVVPDIVLAHAVAPSGEGDDSSIDASATVQAQIQHAMEGYDLQIEVSSEQGTATSDGGLLSLSGTFRTYTCTMRYEPWPSSLSIAGVSLGAPAKLSHERAVTVDPWRPGVVM